MSFVRRPLVDTLLAKSKVPVLVLEGARAVGKTTAARRQLADEAGYSYQSMADPAELALAQADADRWLGQLGLPAIVDEAQLCPALPLAAKELVDRLGPGNHLILTGSASIGRAGLGGADPLARRSQRLTMYPLTPWELQAKPSSLVDALFDAELRPQTHRAPTDAELLDAMRIGGFPGYVLADPPPTADDMRAQVLSDLTATLTETVLPGQIFSAPAARAALESILRTPGGILNASRMASALDLDRRTVDHYLGIFARLFLVFWLPNLATRPAKQDHSRAKIHPVDTSFAVTSLERAGVDILTRRELFGQLLESYAAIQVAAAAQWAGLPTTAYYWRQASTTNPEVDIVLIDGRGRTVGIEVKASRRIEARDLRGLRALQESRGLHRGFIIYTGERIFQIEDDIWLLPIAALDGSGFDTRDRL